MGRKEEQGKGQKKGMEEEGERRGREYETILRQKLSLSFT